MKVWIDFENVPHVQVFKRWIKHLEGEGHEIILTADILGSLLRLCELFDLRPEIIGHLPGRGKWDQLRVILIRSGQLRKWANGQGIDIALNHGSRSHQLAAWSLGIPVMTLDDYEHSFQLFSKLFATEVFFPGIVFEKRNPLYKKIRTYDGVKEHLSIDFHSLPSDRSVLDSYNIPNDQIIVVIREPSATAHYHNELSTELFSTVLAKVRDHPQSWCVALPRDNEGKKRYENHEKVTVITPGDAVDGHSLLASADLVISGGGTMGREAAVMGVPAVSVFCGKKGGVDQYLEEVGRLQMIRSTQDIEKVEIKQRSKIEPLLPGDLELINTLTGHLERIQQRKKA